MQSIQSIHHLPHNSGSFLPTSIYTYTYTHTPTQDPMLVVNEIIEVITERNPTFNHYPGIGAFVLR